MTGVEDIITPVERERTPRVDHRREAEKCIERARGVDFEHAAFLHREAQVHATLAQADAALAQADATRDLVRELHHIRGDWAREMRRDRRPVVR